jgi:hypothetical protein
VAHRGEDESRGGEAAQEPFALLLHLLTQAGGVVFGSLGDVASVPFGQAFDWAKRSGAHVPILEGIGIFWVAGADRRFPRF